MPRKYDVETDVVVVGYGFAGAVAAISAHDAGASVVILEKMPQAGGNSRVSGGNCVVTKPTEDAVRGLSQYLSGLCMDTAPADVIDALVRGAQTLPEWFAGLGGDLSVPDKLIISNTYPRTIKGPGFPKVPGGVGTFEKRCLRGDPDVPPSLRMWRLLSRNVSERGIKVYLNAPVQELIKGDNGEIVGVLIEIDGRRASIRSRRAVIMTCGGFENDEALKRDYLPPKPLKFVGNPGNTGDGIRMAQKIGADIWHMTRSSCIIGFQTRDFDAAFGIFFPADGFIYVDRYGRRYVNETGIELHEFYRMFSEFDTEHVEFPRIPSWGIFNEQTRLAGPLTWNSSGYNRDLYAWSADNSREIERGWIVKADSVAGLAERLRMSQQALQDTLSRYNQHCAAGKDKEFGRDPDTLKPLTPPYYAIELYPAVLNTQGGAKRDASARVVGADGEPIPRLYSAGEFGSIWGYLYQGATNITECLVFGRIAGRNAAAS
jgi:succinate dehydrogenase/fumarate reductase flavoprotein subunit